MLLGGFMAENADFKINFMYFVYVIMILIKMRKVWWPTKIATRPTGWETLSYAIPFEKSKTISMNDYY